MAQAITRKTDFAVITGFLLVLGIAFFTMSKDSAVVSNLITLTFPYVLFIFARQYNRGTIPQTYNAILLASFVLVFVNISISGPGGFDYYKKAIMYIAALAWFICCNSIRVSKRTVYYFFGINLLLIFLYLNFYRHGLEFFEGQLLLTLNFSNPNLTGMFLLHSLLYIGIFIVCIKDITKRKFNRILLLLISIPLFCNVLGLLMMTGSRSSLMSLMFFGFLLVLDMLCRKRFWLKKWALILLAAFPFIFVFIYITYAGTIGDTVSFGMESAGKSNTSRNHVWLPIIENIWHYFVIGDYYGISGGSGVSQLHNTHLDVYASYGIVPLLLYIYLLYKLMYNASSRSHSFIQRSGLYAFISVLVLCSFEASLVAGSAGLFLLTGGFLMITNLNNHKSSPRIPIDSHENSPG